MIFDKPVANDDQRPGANDVSFAPDRVQPFMLDTSHLRGRIVRLPHVMNDIIAAHGYPEAVAALVGEALCLTTVLAGMLKFDGIFTLQAKSDGLIRSLVCDMTNDGSVRAYAGFDKEAVLAATDTSFSSMLRDGYLSFTVDQAEGADRYQGIVPLDGKDLTDCVRNYFLQSEQIGTAFVSHVGKNKDGAWVGGALMLQHVAAEGGHTPDAASEAELRGDDWQRSMMLMQTLTADEMLHGALPLNDILYRLFHEEGVRVFPPIAIRKGCRCSMERIRSVLDNLSADDRLDLVENGVISVTCEFCNTTYEFPAKTLDEALDEKNIDTD